MQVRFPQGSFYSQNSRKLAKCIKMPLKRKKTPQNGNKHPKIGKVAPPGRNTPQKHETCPNNAQNTISYSPSCHMSASKSRKITHQTESNTPKTDRDSSAVLCVQTSTLKPDIQVQSEIPTRQISSSPAAASPSVGSTADCSGSNVAKLQLGKRFEMHENHVKCVLARVSRPDRLRLQYAEGNHNIDVLRSTLRADSAS